MLLALTYPPTACTDRPGCRDPLPHLFFAPGQTADCAGYESGTFGGGVCAGQGGYALPAVPGCLLGLAAVSLWSRTLGCE
jgi:hypothetical protein